MPIYDYRCEACGENHEAIQKMSEPPLVNCPACGEPALKKQISAPNFRLKGGGWYETDFKTGDKKNIAGESRETSAVKEGKSDKSSGTDSKPATDTTASSGKTSAA